MTHDTQTKRRWWILAILGMAQLMVVLDATIVNIALPSAQHDLGFSNDARQWIVTGYSLAFGSLLLLGGKVGDVFGRKRTLIAGLLGFAAASAAGGAAQSFAMLVSARALQGAFGALLAPSALGLLTTTFSDPKERGKAFGIYGAIAGGGGAVGLLLGGVLTEYLSWRWCLYVNLAFAVPAALGALALLPNSARSTRPRIDVPGTLAASSGVFSLVFGFSKAQTLGWGDPVTIGFLIAGVVLLGVFVAIERRVTAPLLPLRVVADRNRGGAYLAVGLVAIGMFGVFLFLTYYLQTTLGYSPVTTGLAFLPMVGAIMVAASTSTAKLLPRVGPRPLIPTGMALLTGIGLHSTYVADVLPGLLVLGLGIGLVMAPSMNTATAGVRPQDAGVASAMVNTAQQVGGSIGTALLSTLAASAATSYAESHPGQLALAAVHSYTTAFWWSAAIFAAAAVVTGLLLRSGAPEHAPAGAPVLAH
jgi:EmrB/QacA subfamily drug resistance transporter